MMKKFIGIILLSIIMLSFFKKQEANIPNIWNRFENWLTKNAVHLKEDLNPPASKTDIEKLEKALGVELPKDYVDFLMIHDGQKRDSEGLINVEELLSSERVLGEWTIWKDLLDSGDFEYTSDPDPQIKNDWWNSKWIPITYDGHGNHYCIDLDPESGGKHGQIIRMWHDSSERELIANSFKEWINSYISALEKGEYVYSEDWAGIIDKDDL